METGKERERETNEWLTIYLNGKPIGFVSFIIWHYKRINVYRIVCILLFVIFVAIESIVQAE